MVRNEKVVQTKNVVPEKVRAAAAELVNGELGRKYGQSLRPGWQTHVNNMRSQKPWNSFLDPIVEEDEQGHNNSMLSNESDDSDESWRILFPGRRLIEEYAKSEGLGKPIVLQNSLIKQLSTDPSRVPIDLRNIMRNILSDDDENSVQGSASSGLLES